MQKQSLLLLPRLYLAMIFLVASITKVRDATAFQVGMMRFLSAAHHNAFDFYRDIVGNVLLPHAFQLSGFIIAAELFVGICMFLGFAARPASAVAIFLLLNYAVAKASAPWSPASNDWADICLALIVGIGGAGPTYAVDAWLMRTPKITYH